MRSFLIFLTFSILAWAQPQLAHANRVAKAKAKPVPAKTSALKLRGTKTKTTAKSKLQKAKDAISSGVKLRSVFRTQKALTKSALKKGHLIAASAAAHTSPVKPRNFRERFAVWRLTRSVQRAARKTAKKSSKEGDVRTLREALTVLSSAESSSQIGAFTRWQANSAKNKAMRNLAKSAKRSYRNREPRKAEKILLSGMRLKPGSKAAKRFGKQIIRDAFSTAKRYAKQGNPTLTIDLMSMAQAAAQRYGLPHNQKKEDKLIENAFNNLLPAMLKEANQAYKNGRLTHTAKLLSDVRTMKNSGRLKFSRRLIRRYEKLSDKLAKEKIHN